VRVLALSCTGQYLSLYTESIRCFERHKACRNLAVASHGYPMYLGPAGFKRIPDPFDVAVGLTASCALGHCDYTLQRDRLTLFIQQHGIAL
jgi:hypothetical protein